MKETPLHATEADESGIYQVFRHAGARRRVVVHQADLALALAIANARFAHDGFSEQAEHVLAIDTVTDDDTDDTDEVHHLGLTERMLIEAARETDVNDDVSIDTDAGVSGWNLEHQVWHRPTDVLEALSNMASVPEEREDPCGYRTREALCGLLAALRAETGLTAATQQAIDGAMRALPSFTWSTTGASAAEQALRSTPTEQLRLELEDSHTGMGGHPEPFEDFVDYLVAANDNPLQAAALEYRARCPRCADAEANEAAVPA